MELPKGKNKRQMMEIFLQEIQEIQEKVVKPMSSRGWGYFLEGRKVITKAEIDIVQTLINDCRKNGLLPVDFTAQEEGRQFSGIEIPDILTGKTPVEYMRSYLQAVLECQDWYTPDWWDGEKYYIQMIVEKIDLKYLFEDVCKQYHIPIATSKGWGSIIQRAEYARRFKEAEEKALQCVLLYCGDHDADGLRISDFLYSNLNEIKDIVWKDGESGYDPENLIIHRFGLNYDFIMQHNLVWIENLITGSGGNLADPSHKNFHMQYVQEYLSKYGARKVEANAILANRKAGIQLARSTIEKYLGADALARFQGKRKVVQDEINNFRSKIGIDDAVEKALELIDNELRKESEDK